MSYPNDMSRLADGIGATQASRDDFTGPTGPKRPARALIRETLRLVKPAADAMAADATAYTAAEMIRARCDGRLLGAYFIPEDAATADDADFATVEVQKADGLGGAGTTMASAKTKITGGTGDLAAGKVAALTPSATIADLRFARGSVVGFAIAKSGAGVAVPKGQFVVDVEWESDDEYPV